MKSAGAGGRGRRSEIGQGLTGVTGGEYGRGRDTDGPALNSSGGWTSQDNACRPTGRVVKVQSESYRETF